MKIYVGNMNFRTTEESLEALFSHYGKVNEVSLIMDRETGRPRGFAFVTMADPASGQKAIESLNGAEFEGRSLTVNEARPKASRPGGFGGPRRGGPDQGAWNGGGDRSDRKDERW